MGEFSHHKAEPLVNTAKMFQRSEAWRLKPEVEFLDVRRLLVYILCHMHDPYLPEFIRHLCETIPCDRYPQFCNLHILSVHLCPCHSPQFYHCMYISLKLSYALQLSSWPKNSAQRTKMYVSV